MIKVKRIIFGICIILAFIVLGLTFKNQEIEDNEESVQFLFYEEKYLNDLVRIEMQYLEPFNMYFLFLPYGVDSSKTHIVTNDNLLFINDEEIYENYKYSFDIGEEYNVCLNGKDSKLMVMQGSCQNIMFINTKSGNLDYINDNQENKEEAEMLVLNDKKVNYAGKLEFIKGRGNVSWAYSLKKPYNIKLDKSTKILGMPASKNWCLYANYIDESLLKNKFLYDLADDLGASYTPKIEVVDIYFNGQYFGVYTLVQKVEIGPNFIDIYDLARENEILNKGLVFENLLQESKTGKEIVNGTMKWYNLENESSTYDGGYIIENELIGRYPNEKSGFLSLRGMPNILKEPEYATHQEVLYISEYYQRFEDALYSDSGFNEYGGHYSNYVDVDSLARMYIVQEFSKNLDAGITSSYLVKDAGEKFLIGPIWDLDNSLGTNFYRDGIDYFDPNGFSAASSAQKLDPNLEEYMPTIFSAAYQHQDFRDYVYELYEEDFKSIIDEHINKLNDLALDILESVKMDHILWNNYNTYDSDVVGDNYYNGCIKGKIIDFVQKRIIFMDQHMNSEGFSVIYKSNGGESYMFNPYVYSELENVIIKENEYINNEKEFVSWNTNPDGTGVEFLPGEEITITENLVLYAQWR